MRIPAGCSTLDLTISSQSKLQIMIKLFKYRKRFENCRCIYRRVRIPVHRPDSRVVLPKTADFSETTTSFDYEIPAGAPDGTIACVTYSLGDHKVGQAYLTLTDSSQTAADIPEKLVSQAATATAQDSSDTASQTAPRRPCRSPIRPNRLLIRKIVPPVNPLDSCFIFPSAFHRHSSPH